MAAYDPAERNLIARASAHESWARTTDRAARTAAGRKAADDRFLRQVREQHPDVDERTAQQMAEHARSAYYVRLALKSAQARRVRKAKPSTADGGASR